MSNPQPNLRTALARVFPAFGRPGQLIDLPHTSGPIEHINHLDYAIAEPGAPPSVKHARSSCIASHCALTPATTSADMITPRLGQIAFVNCLPIVLPIERQHVTVDAELVLETPARLNAMFDEGTLEVGAMSSYYFLSKRNLTLCPDISISCRGPVGSVLLFLKTDPSKLAHGRVVTSAQSATSVNLLKILFAEQFGNWPDTISDTSPDLDCADFDGALVIGDRALEVDNDWSQRYVRIDLGAWWWQRYSLPMVFGVWAARAEWVDQNHYRFAELCRALRAAKALGLTRRWKDTLFEARRRTGLSLSRLERYFKEELNFDFEVEHAEGLALYETLLGKYHLIH